ncbi:HEPN domain-containing protein [Granulicella rosea]|uniref:HEPN domain-containing protein n=1 Tax=Granulicella rosea TaxID=474952 RepID=A0A239LAX2_9BACT|nr:HEPN domain-containing protein [Granulicella rosea]SNT27797.1 HEPN domain-containing protein [Granulicella rosea]
MTAILTKVKLQELMQLRLDEAEVLRAAGFHDAACYLCGYAMEFALKACVCKRLNLAEYPEKDLKGIFKTHLASELILLAGLRDELTAIQDRNSGFEANWQIATRWGPEQRYERVKTDSDTDELMKALKSEPDGVLRWLTQQW